jgi:hypothetical protein
MKRHNLDSLSLVAGMIFALLGGAFLIPDEPFGVPRALLNGVRWGWPLLLIAIGVAILWPKKPQTTESVPTDEAPAAALEEMPPSPLG